VPSGATAFVNFIQPASSERATIGFFSHDVKVRFCVQIRLSKSDQDILSGEFDLSKSTRSAVRAAGGSKHISHEIPEWDFDTEALSLSNHWKWSCLAGMFADMF